MDSNSLQSLIDRFLKAFPDDPLIQEQLATHERRRQRAVALLQLDRIPELTREELEAFFKDTDAWYGVRGKQLFWRRLFGESEERIPALRKTLAKLIERAQVGLTAPDFNELIQALPGIGPAYLSEILALRFPDRYWLLNKQVTDFLQDQRIDLMTEVPPGKKTDQGERYMAVGRHLTEVRKILSDAMDRPVDHMLTDLFLYWSNQQKSVAPADPWVERVARWRKEYMPQERIAVRKECEDRARNLLQTRLGQFDEMDLRQFLADLNGDWYSGKERKDRFSPAFAAPQVSQMSKDIAAFNQWAQRIWQAPEDQIDHVLNEFWEKLEVAGAGSSLPTALLYLRDPEKHAVWIPVMSKGLEVAAQFVPGAWRTASAYRQYLSALASFRNRYHLVPQELDVILWAAARGSEVTVVGQGSFEGFTEETFAFLQELARNNKSDWMHKDGDANERRYKEVLREPLRRLFQDVAPAMAEIDPLFETEVKFGKVMAGIKKRWPDEVGPYRNYLWGAFYRQGHSKQTDAQLFVSVGPHEVTGGFCVAGSEAKQVLAQFRRNVEQAPNRFLALLKDLPPGVRVWTAPAHGLPKKEITIGTIDDLKQLMDVGLIDVTRSYPSDEVVEYGPDFTSEVEQLFEALYPVYEFAISENVVDVPPGDGGDEIEVELPYSLEQLQTDTYLDLSTLREIELLLDDRKQLVFYGPPGTGKTFIASKFAQYWVESAPDPQGEFRVVQFHPSYAYEEFVEGIRPQSEADSDGHIQLTYPVKKGLFREFCEEARGNPKRRYVLILDEMNRGELPRVLGELLYLLEYRTKSVTLPYSGQAFAIPGNVFLIGTMNTADRSIALVDHALRRRFHFVMLKPDPEVLRGYLEGNDNPEVVWLADLLDLLNRKLQGDGIEWHLQIGHSHLMRPDMDQSRLRLIWKHSIMPTLEEYFYRQPEKLRAYDLDTLMAELGVV